MKLYDLINPTYLVSLFTFYGGGGGGKGGGGQTQPPPPPAAPPPPDAAPMKNPNSSRGSVSETQSDSMNQREGTRSLRVDLNSGTGASSGSTSSSGLNIPS